MDQKQNAHRYQSVKHRLVLVGILIDVLFLLFFFYSGGSFFLRDFVLKVSANRFIVCGFYIFCLSGLMYLIHIPLGYYSGYVWEHKFKLSNQNALQWFKDDLKKSIFGFFVALLLIEVAYFLLISFSEYWWVLAALFWVFFSFILAKLTPNYIVPLFFKYSDVEDESLKKSIFSVFEKCKVSLKEIYKINLSAKTKKANAFLCGVGKNRRVVLSDTLIERFKIEEIKVVIAHELAHYKHKDIIKLLCVNSVIVFFGFYIVHSLFSTFFPGRIEDVAYFPMLSLMLMAFGFVTMPVGNAFSRFVERKADRFSIEQTKDPEHFISAMEKLGDMNLAERDPGRLKEVFFCDHPPIGKRIKMAEDIINQK